MKSEIFRPYDIRGQWQIDFDANDVIAITSSFLTYFSQLEPSKAIVVIGHDARPSSKEIYDICVDTALAQGFLVVGLGLCTTPMVNIAYHCNPLYACRVMITASHNPWSHNGFKLFYRAGAVWREELAKIAALATGMVNHSDGCPGALLDATPIISFYTVILGNALQTLPWAGPILVDCMHGAAGPILKKILAEYPKCQVRLFRETPYCDLPDKNSCALAGPDPSNITNLQPTIKELRNNGLPLAMLFDGDVDRFMVVTAEGRLLSGDELLVLFAEHFLPKQASFAANVAGSVLLELVASRNNQKVCRVPVGVSALKEKMLADELALGGEPSAHFLFLKEHYLVDDALFMFCKFMQIITKPSFLLSSWIVQLPTVYSMPIQKIFFASRAGTLHAQTLLLEHLKNMEYPASFTDGIRLFFSDFAWMLIRPSNTENCLSWRIEADTEQSFCKLKDFFATKILPVIKGFG